MNSLYLVAILCFSLLLVVAADETVPGLFDNNDLRFGRSSCPSTSFNNSDYLLLVQSNQITFCGSKKSDCNQHLVEQLYDNDIFFTIHGLWPQLEHPIGGHSWPQCCSGDRFNENNLGGLKKTMESHAWPKVTPFTLWEHEWEKHGTCALHAAPSIPYIRSQYDYFKAATDLYFKANVNRMLKDSGVEPSDSRPQNVGYLNSLFNAHYGVAPLLTYYEYNHQKLISEVWMCVSKTSMEFIQCPSSLSTGHLLHEHDSVFIPTKQHLH